MFNDTLEFGIDPDRYFPYDRHAFCVALEDAKANANPGEAIVESVSSIGTGYFAVLPFDAARQFLDYHDGSIRAPATGRRVDEFTISFAREPHRELDDRLRIRSLVGEWSYR